MVCYIIQTTKSFLSDPAFRLGEFLLSILDIFILETNKYPDVQALSCYEQLK